MSSLPELSFSLSRESCLSTCTTHGFRDVLRTENVSWHSHTLLLVCQNHVIGHAGSLDIAVPCEKSATRHYHSGHSVFDNIWARGLLQTGCVESADLLIYQVRQHATQSHEQGLHLVSCDTFELVCGRACFPLGLVLSTIPCSENCKCSPRAHSSGHKMRRQCHKHVAQTYSRTNLFACPPPLGNPAFTT